MEKHIGMTPIVKMITRIICGPMLVFGAYIVLYGHITPGGGFPGGVMVALAYILITLAYGRVVVESKVSGIAASVVDDIGALIFWSVGMIGLFIGGNFLLNFLEKGEPFHLLSAGTLIINNIAITLKVGMCLYAIFLALAILQRVVIEKPKEEEE
ncbi:hypothetical protein KAW18_04595 [candidate division WOR-3 bacterium]|nr:hypothetical protein [candidate division WOR-3 bacterium]